MFIVSTDACADAFGSLTDRYIALAIQGDLLEARRVLQESEQQNTVEYTNIAGRFAQRFVERSEPMSPETGIRLVDEVVAAYRDYWAHSLFADSLAAKQEGTLRETLGQLLPATPANGGSQDVYRSLDREIRALGYGVLAIPAPPLQDLFIWGRQRNRDYTVELTDQTRVVKVAFMNDFVSLGWKDYAALGLATTTGWVEDGVLYCVEQAYMAGTERFEVSYLKHEARHLADLEQFSDLRSVDLEYRAKLTELAFASQTLNSLLADFSAKSAPNPGSPHAEANYRVLHDLYAALFDAPLPEDDGYRWESVRAEQVNASARGLLRQNTQALEAGRAHPSR